MFQRVTHPLRNGCPEPPRLLTDREWRPSFTPTEARLRSKTPCRRCGSFRVLSLERLGFRIDTRTSRISTCQRVSFEVGGFHLRLSCWTRLSTHRLGVHEPRVRRSRTYIGLSACHRLWDVYQDTPVKPLSLPSPSREETVPDVTQDPLKSSAEDVLHHA